MAVARQIQGIAVPTVRGQMPRHAIETTTVATDAMDHDNNSPRPVPTDPLAEDQRLILDSREAATSLADGRGWQGLPLGVDRVAGTRNQIVSTETALALSLTPTVLGVLAGSHSGRGREDRSEAPRMRASSVSVSSAPRAPFDQICTSLWVGQ